MSTVSPGMNLAKRSVSASATREARVDKCAEKILDGKGLRDR
jgi:uncharacterized protein YdeI (YjbR/CyaY-like superfamily)